MAVGKGAEITLRLTGFLGQLIKINGQRNAELSLS